MAISVQPRLRPSRWHWPLGKEPSPTGGTLAQNPASNVKLAGVFLQLGGVSFGGKSTNSYLFQELVRRRGWMSNEDFAETYALAKLLPGATGPSLVVTVAQRLQGPWAGFFCLGAFTVPGALLMLAASALLFGQALPAWAMNGLNGGAAASLGLLLASTLQMAGSARNARLWPVFAAAAFAGSAVLQMNFMLLLLSLSAASILANRSRKEASK